VLEFRLEFRVYGTGYGLGTLCDLCCLLVLDSVTSTPQWIRQPRPRVCLKEGKLLVLDFRVYGLGTLCL
jgi:hypothetical protein